MFLFHYSFHSSLQGVTGTNVWKDASGCIHSVNSLQWEFLGESMIHEQITILLTIILN